MNLTTAIGFDRLVENGNPQFRFTFLSTKTGQNGGTPANTGTINEPRRNYSSQVFSIDGDTIWDAGRNWNMRSSRRLFIGQAIVVVVGEETAREGMGEIIDFLLRHQDLRERTWLVVCKGSAADFLNAQPQIETVISIEIDRILREAWLRSSKVKGIDLFNFSYDLLTPGKEAVLPYMVLLEPPEPSSTVKLNPIVNTTNDQNQNVSGDEQDDQPQRKSFETTGFAVFRGDKMVGFMSREESQGFLYLTDQIKGAALPIAIDDNKKNVSIRIQGSKTKIKPLFSEEGLGLDISIKTSGDLMEQDGNIIKISAQDFKKAEEQGRREIERRCLEAFSKSQEFKTDIIGLGDMLHRRYPDEWKEMKDNWEQIFPTVNINVNVELKIKQTGVISDPINVQ